MNAAQFSGEDDRRRFYGEDDRPRPSEEVDFGLEWRVMSDPAAVYALRWIKDTREIYVMRRPQPRFPMADDPGMAASWPLPLANMDLGVELLGWAEGLDALEDALDGWELQMPADDSLQWVRHRLAEAATETERRRGPGAGGWWPGSPPSR